jgi:hypothetical protein
MKSILLAAVVLISFPAHATYYQLVSCQMRFMAEYHANVYIGTYRSQYGNLFTRTFTTYCPQSISE